MKSCNSWIIEDGVYKWEQGGAPVEPGEYNMKVDATLNGEFTNWQAFFTVTLP